MSTKGSLPGRPPPTPSSPRRFGRRVWSLGRVLFLTAALVATFGMFFLTGMRIANRARDVRVPDLAGLDADRAARLVADAGLVMRIDARRPDAKVAPNRVIDQEPQAGSVLRRQRVVKVRVSDGRRDPVVPSVVGQIERTAEILLADEKITLGSRSEIRSASYDAGVIVSQDPPPAAHAATVALLVNRGEPNAGFVMPDVIGAIGARAIDVLRRRGFRVTVGAEVPYPGLPSGVVVRQTPQAGFRVAEADTIVIEVSR
jgi:beta-lactam-binding protein with PASTA domain